MMLLYDAEQLGRGPQSRHFVEKRMQELRALLRETFEISWDPLPSVKHTG
jgi:hypothetical protein